MGAVALTAEQRMALAKVSGLAQRYAWGVLAERPRAEALQDLWSITWDPIVFGVALGAALANVELDEWPLAHALVDLHRAAGADEHVAERQLAWHRTRPEYQSLPQQPRP